jgi:hypothetical protein
MSRVALPPKNPVALPPKKVERSVGKIHELHEVDICRCFAASLLPIIDEPVEPLVFDRLAQGVGRNEIHVTILFTRPSHNPKNQESFVGPVA